MVRIGMLLLALLPALIATGCAGTSLYEERYGDAQQALYEGDYDSAALIIRELLEETGDSLRTLSLALEQAVVTSDIRQALEVVDRLIQVDEDAWYRYYGIKALLLLEAGQEESAARLYRERHQRNPYDIENGLSLISVLRGQGRDNEAFEVARELYTYHPDSLEVLEILAGVADERGEDWKDVLEYENTLR